MSYRRPRSERDLDDALRRGIYGPDPHGAWTRGVQSAAATSARRRQPKIHVPPRFDEARP